MHTGSASSKLQSQSPSVNCFRTRVSAIRLNTITHWVPQIHVFNLHICLYCSPAGFFTLCTCSTSSVPAPISSCHWCFQLVLEHFQCFSASTLLVGWQERHPACKKTGWWGVGVVICLDFKVQTCTWPSWCHCYSLSLASVKSRLVLPFWCRLTWVVPEKGR